MRLDDFNSDREFTEDCNKLSIKVFAFYANGRLTRQEERLIDSHCINCGDCRANLAYVFEIIKGREKLSADGQTLLLKYLQDPIYKDTLEKLKDTIKEDILSEIKPTLLAESLMPKSTVLTNELIKNHFSNTTNLQNNGINSADKIPSNNKNDTKKDFLFFKSLKTKLRETANQKGNYFYFVSGCLLVLLCSLSAFTYLTLNSKLKHQSSISSFSSYESPVIQNITQQNKQLTSNLYQQLDTSIDQYLSSKNIDELNKAEAIAKDIEDKYGDKYGVDLVGYYQAIPSSAIEKLLILHKSLEEIFEQASGDNYQQRLEVSQKLEKDFFSLGNLIEAYKAKALINKLYVQLNNNEQAKSIEQEGLSFSINSKYKFLQVNFLLWQAKRICDTDVISGEKDFLQVIDLGTKLNLYKSVNSAGMSLATLYYQGNDDDKAFALIKKLLPNFSNYKNTQAITLLQIAGLTSFNLHYYDVSESYLKEAIINSQDINSPAFLQRSYVFLGLVYSEQKKFSEADEFYSKAEAELSNIKDDKARSEDLMVLTGYKAKAMLLKEDYSEASKLYNKQISLINDLHMNNNNLYMSQSHEGLAIALTSLGQKDKAQEYIAIASHFQNLAQANKQTNNCLLSFIPTNCNTK
jgi:hypothetical protein